MGLITIQPIGQSTFRLSMARGLQHISNMLKSLIEVPGERIFPKARIGDLPVFGGLDCQHLTRHFLRGLFFCILLVSGNLMSHGF